MSIVFPIVAFVISCFLVRYMLPYVMLLSLKKRLIDPIDPRKVHNVPASRLGGFTFLPSIVFSVLFSLSFMGLLEPQVFQRYMTPELTLEIAAILLLYLIGIFDDILGVKYSRKFVVQVLAALLIVCSGTYVTTMHGFLGIYDIPQYVGIPATIFFYVFVTNSINLIDGIDGLASLLSIMALVAYGLLFFLDGCVMDDILAFATIGALLPFCYSNIMGLRPGFTSKIFMGDAGALVVGAVLGFFSIKLWNGGCVVAGGEEASISYVLAFTMLVIPCFDVVRIIIHRFRGHKPLFEPDKNHIHHKLMALGNSPRRALMMIIAINIFFLLLNLLLHKISDINVIVLVDVVVWSVFHIILSKKIN